MNQELLDFLKKQNDEFIRQENEKALVILWLKV